jgi:hypothetical protein
MSMVHMYNPGTQWQGNNAGGVAVCGVPFAKLGCMCGDFPGTGCALKSANPPVQPGDPYLAELGPLLKELEL